MEGEKEPYHTLMSQLGKHTKNVKAATILAAAKKRRECVCVFVCLLIKRPVFTQSTSQSFTTSGPSLEILNDGFNILESSAI